MATIFSYSSRSTRRECWNCKYWNPERRIVRSNGDVETVGSGICTCKSAINRYGQSQGNIASCSKFERWNG